MISKEKIGTVGRGQYCLVMVNGRLSCFRVRICMFPASSLQLLHGQEYKVQQDVSYHQKGVLHLTLLYFNISLQNKVINSGIFDIHVQETRMTLQLSLNKRLLSFVLYKLGPFAKTEQTYYTYEFNNNINDEINRHVDRSGWICNRACIWIVVP